MNNCFLKYIIITILFVSAFFTSCKEKEDEMTSLGNQFMGGMCECFRISDAQRGKECAEKVIEAYEQYLENEDFILATNKATKCDEPDWWDSSFDFDEDDDDDDE